MTDLRYQSPPCLKPSNNFTGECRVKSQHLKCPYCSALLSLSYACAAGSNRLKHIKSLKKAAEFGLRERSLMTRLKELQELASSQEVMLPKIHQEAVCIRIHMS